MAFVLCNSIPIVPGIDVQVSSERFVTLRVHSGASPDDVANMYSAARTQTYQGRPRSMGVNALRAFAFAYLLRPGREWPERWGQWNRRYPEPSTCYGDTRTFQQAATRARRSL